MKTFHRNNSHSICFIITFVIFTLVFTSCGEIPQTADHAKNLASYHLKRVSKLVSFKDSKIDTLFPVWDLQNKTIVAYDVKLITNQQKDAGYILVGLDKTNFPILEFAAEGPCLHEQLKKKVGLANFRLIWVNPTFIMAVSEDGKLLATLGGSRVSTNNEVEKNIKTRPLEYFVNQFKTDHGKAIENAWNNLPGGGKSTSDLVEDYPTDPIDCEVYAEGEELKPSKIEQIPEDTRYNTTDCKSGCGACAWTNFLVWHDQMWTPELLMGSQNQNGINYGDEDQWECYIDRVQMEISRKIDTDCSKLGLGIWGDDTTGWVITPDFDDAFDYISDNLGFSFIGQEQGGNDVQRLYNLISEDRRPIMIFTGDHYSVMAGFLCNNESNSLEDQWLYINTGWKNSQYKYISTEYLENYWYLKEILPNEETKKIYSYTTDQQPVFITTKGTNNEYNAIWMFWRNSDGKIHYKRGNPGEFPTEGNFSVLDVNSIFPPSLCTDGNKIYLAYVTPDKTINLRVWTDPIKGWIDLMFPSYIRTNVKPVICGSQGNWFTVGFCDSEYGVQLIATQKDLQRSGAWPENILSHSSNLYYWKQVDGTTNNSPLSMTEYEGKNILIWHQSNLENNLNIRIGERDGSNHKFFYKSTTRNWSEFPEIVINNNIIYLVYTCSYNRIAVDKMNIYRLDLLYNDENPHNPHVTLSTEHACYLTENSINRPTAASILIENNPVLAIGWSNYSSPHSLNMRFLSMDTNLHHLDYTNHP